MTGGTSGTYTLSFWKDVTLGFDTNVGSYTFQYNGVSGSKTQALTYSTAGTYHMAVEFNGSTLWSQPSGASRLTVTVPTVSVTSYSFNPSTITLGQTTTASFIMTGGAPGSYTLQFWKYDIFSTIQGTATFSYDGTSLTKTQAFTPILTGPYYMVLVLNSSTVWTEPTNGLTVASAPALAVTSYSFSPVSITTGQSSTGSVAMTGGTSGTYTLSFWKDVTLGFDTNVGSYTFQYNGVSGSKTQALTYSTAGTYHMAVEFNGATLWSQPSGASRLTVNVVTTPALAVTSYSFSPSTVRSGQSASASIAMTGGSSATYALVFWKDGFLGFDTEISRYSFTYNGVSYSTTQTVTPTSDGTYHLSLELAGSTVWSQQSLGGHLIASTPSVAFTSYFFSPASITAGQSSTGSVVVTGGSAGTYTLAFWQDVTLGFDNSMAKYTFQHNGVSTTLSKSFTPPGPGTYHMSVEFGTSTLWSQPNDTSRLTVLSLASKIKIESVNVPSEVTEGQTYNYSITLKNYNSTQTTVSLKIESLSVGEISTTAVTIPANNSINIPITAAFAPSGQKTLTYTVIYSNQAYDTLNKTIEVKTATAASTSTWRKDIQPGDILLTRSGGQLSFLLSFVNDFWSHAGIYVGNNTVIEANGKGFLGKDGFVIESKIEEWDHDPTNKTPNKECVGLFRVRGVTDSEIDQVVR